MTISELYIENFKGLLKGTSLKIKPITVFVGANSSGKSSCIHALGCLSQTVKLSNNRSPLILDDEAANIHLGRFIDVIHSKSYQDLITLGISIDNIKYLDLEKGKKKRITKSGSLMGKYSFKCSRRTQNINLESANISLGDHSYLSKRIESKLKHTITHLGGGAKAALSLEKAFFFDSKDLFYRRTQQVEPFIPLLQHQEIIKNALNNTFYLGPFRQPPSRNYPTRGSIPVEVGAMGEYTVTILANEVVQTASRPHIKQISKWLEFLGLASSFNVSRVARSDLFDVKLKMKDGDEFPIADLGYGISQILPVLTQCSFAPKNSHLLFEQPELHLHSIAAKRLAKVFTDTAKEKNCKILIETHSPDLLKHFFKKVDDGIITVDDIVVYRISRKNGQSILKEIEVDEFGDVYDNWEKGFTVD